MKQEYKDWFINHTKQYQEYRLSPEVVNREYGSFNLEFRSFWKEEKNRRYTFYNIPVKEVPFHTELSTYIYSLHSFPDTFYKWYHIHLWDKGDFFDEHNDHHVGRKWSYVCELQSSKCNTSLLLDGKSVKESLFDTKVLHRVPPIKEGTRISLTVFGLSDSYYQNKM